MTIQNAVAKVNKAIADIGTSLMLNDKYGTRITHKQSDILWLDMMKSALLSDAVVDKTQLIKSVLKLTAHRSSIRPQYTETLTHCAEFETGDMYLPCLQAEFDEYGYLQCMSTAIDWCVDMDVTINVAEACQLVQSEITAAGLTCDILSTIDAQTICNVFIQEIDASVCTQEEATIALASVVYQCASGSCP